MTDTKPSWQRSPSSGETPGETQDPPTDATSVNGETPQGSSGGKDDIESLKAALKKANQEAASHRHAAKELETLKGQIEQEKLTEKERLEKQVAQLQQQMAERDLVRQDRMVSAELRAVAAQMGWQHPELAIKLADRTELEFDEDGSPSNVESVLSALVKKYPDLTSRSTAGKSGANGATNPSRSQTSGNKELSWDVISKMTPDEYQNRRGEIMAFMQHHPPRFGTQRH